MFQDFELTTKKLAIALDCDQAAIRRWQYGYYLPTPSLLIKIADTFNISTDYMFGLSYDKSLNRNHSNLSFYQRYCTLRDSLNLNDFKVATQCKIADSAVSSWKRLKKFPETTTLLKLSDYLGCRLDFLLGIGT
ncbi:helix-turn-helix domain-containing protein [Pumilibacter muris]|uniref:helix-turn-helix domain-containing protein n=1 Tax=Pumilibacter muris TaxID=2941510 RepID=UPI003B846BCA